MAAGRLTAGERAELAEWLDRVAREASAWADRLDPERTFAVKRGRQLDGLARLARSIAGETRASQR